MNNPLSNDLYEFIRKHITGISQEAFYDSLVESRKSVEGKKVCLLSFLTNVLQKMIPAFPAPFAASI